LGDVVAGMKNIPIPFGDSAVNQLTGIRHHNNKDVWIVVRKHGPEPKYLAYLVSESGISPSPVISNCNIPVHYIFIGGQYLMKRSGDLKISQDGTKLVCSDSLTELCDFDDLTGIVTSKFTFGVPGGRGAEFSLDSKYLYICAAGDQGPQWDNPGWQFDLSKQDSASFIQSIVQLGGGFGSKLQMAPNWKIYAGASPSIDSLHCINNPSMPGLLCNFQNNAVSLLGNNNNQCLVQFLQKYKAYIHDSSFCFPDTTHFRGDIWPPADSIHWNFGDPSSGTSNFSNLATPTHFYSTPGVYVVELFVKHIDNRTDTSWKTISIYAKPTPDLGPDRTVCTGNSFTFDAGPCTGCLYEWKDIASGFTVGTNQTYTTDLPGNYCVIVTNSICTGSDTVQFFTTPVPSFTNYPLYDSICSGETTNIPLTSNPTGATFHWTATLTSGAITGFSADSGLVIGQTLVNTGSTAGIVTYHITPKIGDCSGSTVDFPVTVIVGDSAKVLITASLNNICTGTAVTFTATPTNPGTTPVYQWKLNGVNAGTNSPNYTYSPSNGDVVQCILTSSNTVCTSNNPASSNTISMVVFPNLPVSVLVSPSQNPVCSGTSVTFTATPTNGGATPSYQWKVNGINMGMNSPSYSYIPLNNDIVTCTLTSLEACTSGNPASSNIVTMTVNPLLPVSISIIPSSNPFCIGNSVTFTATPNNGGTNPSYQWKVNGLDAGTNNTTYSYTPVSGDVVTCMLTSSELCTSNNPATSNSVTMIGTPGLPAGVSVTATPNPFCPGSSVTCTATPVNGGTTPAYQWKVNGVNVGTNAPAYTFNPLNNDSVRCVMTSNLTCVSNNPASSNKIVLWGTLAPVVTFTSCFDTITTVNAKPIRLKGGIPLNGTYSGPGVNSATGVFTPSAAGTGTKVILYTYTNAALCSASKTRTILVQTTPAFTCGNNLTDIRDNQVYPTVQIGSQCWMASNLNYGSLIPGNSHQRDNCITEKFCYNNLPANCGIQTSYQWDELMRYDDTPAQQGLCPPGWHVPTEADWNALFANWTNNGFAGSPLKYSGFSGFDAILSGVRHHAVQWDYASFAVFYWSSTSHGSNKAWAHGMNEVDPSVSLYPSLRSNAFSVRCLKD